MKRSFVAALLLGLVYIPTRLVEEANPDWRLVSWLLAFEVVGLTILIGSSVFGGRVSPGPALLVLTAVPWPTWIQSWVTQSLGSVIAWLTTQILDLVGSPCVARGSVIEVGSGLVGIEEACSGIRSFQASWMLAVFFALLYKLGAGRTFCCLTGGLVLSICTNLLRTVALSLLAAHGSLRTMEDWHGLTGTIAASTCFGGVWFLAASLRRPRQGRTLSDHAGALCRGGQKLSTMPSQFRQSSILPALSLVLVAVAEFSTLAWYGVRERRLPPPVTWHIEAPRDQAQFSEMELSRETRRMLRYDEAVDVGWTDINGLRWQAIFLRWNPDGAAGRLARNHTPADCLPAAGNRLVEQQGIRVIPVLGLDLPFRSYLAHTEHGLARVYYCLWEDRCGWRKFEASYSTYSARFAAVRAGVRNSGQRSLELAVWNALSDQEADTALLTVLKRIIRPDP